MHEVATVLYLEPVAGPHRRGRQSVLSLPPSTNPGIFSCLHPVLLLSEVVEDEVSLSPTSPLPLNGGRLDAFCAFSCCWRCPNRCEGSLVVPSDGQPDTKRLPLMLLPGLRGAEGLDALFPPGWLRLAILFRTSTATASHQKNRRAGVAHGRATS